LPQARPSEKLLHYLAFLLILLAENYIGLRQMHFPNFDRVEYEHNVLFEVVFQARFPEIMKISHGEPVEFQDIIRKEGYPEFSLNFPNMPPDIPEEMKKMISSKREFFFFSEKRDWQVSLSRGFVALTCIGSYSNYEEFKGRLNKLLYVFDKIYEPSYFSRIGLRYKNIVNRKILPLPDGEDIKEFIPEYIAPELRGDMSDDVKSFEKTVQFDDSDIKSNVIHAYAEVTGIVCNRQINNEESYLIDIDCFYEEITRGIDDVIKRCDVFKETAWNIFQWSITEKLRRVMGEKSG
jgi:uncharacterized protein (TIGR04255 family)